MAKPNKHTFEIKPNVSFSVEVAGKGEPVVFLHGALGLEWNPFLEELSEHFKVYAPYFPGTGDSTGLEELANIQDVVQCYYELFDKIGLQNLNLIGQSFGGMLSSELAAGHPSRVKSLSLICPYGAWLNQHPVPNIFVLLPKELNELLVYDLDSPLAQTLNAKADAYFTDIEVRLNRAANLMAVGRFIWPTHDKGLRNRLERIKAPTTIIWGKEDKLIPIIYAKEFNEAILHSKLSIIDQASHLVSLEKREAVLNILVDFVKKQTLLV